MSVVRKICDRVAIMEEGTLAETGVVSEVFSHPKTKVAKRLIRQDIDTETDWEIAEAKYGVFAHKYNLNGA